MPFTVVLAPEAVEDLRRLTANVRATVRAALEARLRNEPGKTSRSRIKRLRGLLRPQYRLRVGEVRVFYDVSGTTVEVLAIVAKSEADALARTIRRSGMKEVALSEIKDDLSRFLREAETQEIVITRHGKPAGVLIGFESEEDWFEYRLEHDPRFLRRVEQARNSLRAGRGIKLDDLETE
jgi:prevent-host-death family protein